MDTMELREEELTDEHLKELLKLYLGQYFRRKRRRLVLQKRLENFREEMMGAKAIRYSPLPHSQTNNISDEPLEFRIKCEEIEEKIRREQKESASAMLKVMDMLAFLESESIEKEIMEYRYLDGDSWNEIMNKASMSRSRCNDYHVRGLEKLLQFAKVRKMLSDYERQIVKK